jgi:hypothetical protein
MGGGGDIISLKEVVLCKTEPFLASPVKFVLWVVSFLQNRVDVFLKIVFLSALYIFLEVVLEML